MSDLLAKLYPEHLRTLRARADAALERAGFEHLLNQWGQESMGSDSIEIATLPVLS